MHLKRSAKTGLILAAAALCLGACNNAQVAHPLTEQLAGNSPEMQLDFWHTLATRPVTSNDEAFHGLILYVNGQDDSTDYAGRVEWMNSQNMLPQDFDRPSNEAVHHGTLAVAITRLLDIKGGLIMRLFGPTPRYATRELRYMKIIPRVSPHQTLSGIEFVGLVARIEDYQRVTHVVDSDSLRDQEESTDTPPQEENKSTDESMGRVPQAAQVTS